MLIDFFNICAIIIIIILVIKSIEKKFSIPIDQMNSKNSNPIWLLSKKEQHNNIITFTSKKKYN